MFQFLQLVRVVTETLFLFFQMSICGKIQPDAGAVELRRNVVGADLDEAGVLEELDEDLVDKLVLGDGLDHQHPLSPQLRQHGGHLHWL